MPENSSVKIKPINIKALFAEKNSRLAKLIPGFVYRYIDRIMHIPEVNEILKKYGDLRGIEFSEKIIEHFNVKQNVIGIENVPQKGRFIFASNHPLGGFDGMMLMCNVDREIGEVRFLVNDVLMKIPQLEDVFIPLNKHGANSRDVARTLDEYYRSDIQILIFPSGLASRKIKGRIIDLVWKKHFIQKSIEYKRDIIPVHVSGRNSNFFYNLANIRKFMGIKWNLEMFFLSDETFKHKKQEFTITFGKPISYQTFDKTKTHTEWAEEVKKIVYSLSNQN